jgi:ribosomal protein S27E
MGSLRFRKQFKLAPGLKFNINKKSLGLTLGGRGAHLTYNTKGQRTASVGVPGTGLWYRDTKTVGSSRTRAGHNARGRRPVQARPQAPSLADSVATVVAGLVKLFLWFLLLGFIVSLMLGSLAVGYGIMGGIFVAILVGTAVYLVNQQRQALEAEAWLNARTQHAHADDEWMSQIYEWAGADPARRAQVREMVLAHLRQWVQSAVDMGQRNRYVQLYAEGLSREDLEAVADEAQRQADAQLGIAKGGGDGGAPADAQKQPTGKSSKVRCSKCQHVQVVPRSQPVFVCEQCHTKLKRQTKSAKSS